VPEPDYKKRIILNPGAVAFPGWWEPRPRSAFMAAMATSAMRHGFAATRVEDVVELARASRRTFYASFPNAEECLYAAHEAVLEDALQAIESRGESPEAALQSLMAYFAAWPAHGYLLLVAMPAAGPGGLERHERAQDAMAKRLAECVGVPRGSGDLSRDQLMQARFGAAQRLVQREVAAGKHRGLPRLVPALSAVVSSLVED
jgi:AcrR family transcriptional regulator